MSVAANLVYLEDACLEAQRRIEQIREFLGRNPSISLYRRLIRGKPYYYRKFRRQGVSVSQYVGSGRIDVKKERQEIRRHNARVDQVKQQLALARREFAALSRQLKISRRAYDHERRAGTGKTPARLSR